MSVEIVNSDTTPADEALSQISHLPNESQPEAIVDSSVSQEKELPEGVTPGQSVESAPPAYNPNYKFRAFGEEKEFDEWVRPLVTSKEIEDNLRGMFAKSTAMERYKEDFHTTDTELKGLKGGLDKLREHVGHNDFDSFFKETKIPMDRLWEWFKGKLEYQQMSPEARRDYDSRMGLERQNRELSRAAQAQSQSANQPSEIEVFKREFSLDNLLTQPNHSKIASDYDRDFGPGEFKRFVASRGEAIELSTRKPCTADMALSDALKRLRLDNTQAAQPIGNGNIAVANGNGNPKPVIPNIRGGSASPVKQKPKSIEEMRKNFDQRRRALS